MGFLGTLLISMAFMAAQPEREWAAPSRAELEVAPGHPLFLFAAPGEHAADATGHAAEIIRAWTALPESIRPYSALLVRVRGEEPILRLERLYTVLEALVRIPVFVELTDGTPGGMPPLDEVLPGLLQAPGVKGIHVSGFSFNEYPPSAGPGLGGEPPHVRWLEALIARTAKAGRLLTIELDELHWLRLMSNPAHRSLYQAIWDQGQYVIPVNAQRGPHNIARTAALMGLWLEGAVKTWGQAASSRWYADARFLGLGEFGISSEAAAMPPALYRAMILNGAMTGASLYLFPEAEELWYGSKRHHWDQAIFPALDQLAARGWVARKDLVQRKARTAYQLAPAATPQAFHESLRDLDAVYDEGALLHAAYGMEKPGQIPELILNSGRHYWIPILSPYASVEVQGLFDAVYHPGDAAGPEAWGRLLASHYRPDGEGTAFITRVGGYYYVMHTRENLYEEQTFLIPGMPAPVIGLEAKRTAQGIQVSWPFREEDLSYTVHRRILPETRYWAIREDLGSRRYHDTEVLPGQTAAYAVTAFTREQAPFSGTVNFGDYWVFSRAESRIEEEVILEPSNPAASGSAIPKLSDSRPARQTWWPKAAGLEAGQRAVAIEIAASLEALDEAFQNERLEEILDLYTDDYADPEDWGLHYVRMAYSWFFEHYDACRMARQIREWDFSGFESGREVKVLLYCRFSGVATSDASGRIADVTAYFPKSPPGEVWLTLTDREGPWRIQYTDPPLPDFDTILSFTAPRTVERTAQ